MLSIKKSSNCLKKLISDYKVVRTFCVKQDEGNKDGLSSFIKIVKQTEEQINKKLNETKEIKNETFVDVPEPKFSTLFRNSNLVKSGFIKQDGFLAEGVIKHVMDDTIFIDYGGKFFYITQKPKKDYDLYVRGAKLLIHVLDWELTARFIGSDVDSTLNESEAKILQVINSPVKNNTKVDVNDKLDKEIEDFLKNVSEIK